MNMFRSFYNFLRLIGMQHHLIISMIKRDLAAQYAGSVLGFFWTFVNPVIMVTVFWVVFGLGFKSQPMNDVPFVVWLTAGMAAWFVFADMVNGASGSIVNNSHLIKKTLFQSQILPLIKISASLITHAIFLVVLMILIVFQKMSFSFYFLQFLYYLAGMLLMGMGIGWATAALNVFFRDVNQAVGVCMQIGFWGTPVFWEKSMMPQELHWLILINPMAYIIQGYRDSFIYFIPFWERPWQSLYFWTLTIIIFIGGGLIFKKLKPQFADML